MSLWQLVTFLVIVSLTPLSLHSYVWTIGEHGENVSWALGTNITLNISTSNKQGLDDEALRVIIDESVSVWNDTTSDINMRKVFTDSETELYLGNSITFSTSNIYFPGSAVLGVTSVAYKEYTGEIISADIMVNDKQFLSTSRGRNNYVGDIVTHELGHLLGLGHSQVHGSTMMYVLTGGQYTLSDDDRAGIYSKYPMSDQSLGSISGKIIGGENLIGVFGAHVEAYSVEDGKISGAGVSDDDGTFVINGLGLNKTYLLYIAPVESLTSLPTYYSSRRKNFCTLAGGDYIGSFYYECASVRKGFPKGTLLTASNKNANVGNVTVRCDSSLSNDYLSNKGGGTVNLNIVDAINGSVGDSVSGFFTNYQVEQQEEDHFLVDLSDHAVTSSNQYLEVRVTNQKFYSSVKLKMEVGPGGYSFPLSNYETIDYTGNIDIVARIPLSYTQANNLFTVDIIPEMINNSGSLTGFLSRVGKSKSYFFPAADDFEERLIFYLLTFSVVKYENGVVTKISEKKYDNLRDNTLCPDAHGTYSVKSNAAVLQYEDKKEVKDDSAFSCGTIDATGGGGGGFPPFGFVMTVLLGITLAFRPVFKRQKI